tara:strand:- start:878 stop:1084 length:207 start_codon:yes stop_codon:yes gene_type:complete
MSKDVKIKAMFIFSFKNSSLFLIVCEIREIIIKKPANAIADGIKKIPNLKKIKSLFNICVNFALITNF